MAENRLIRHKENQVIAGVCSGLGHYLDIDPTLVRVAFIPLAFAGGIGFVLYVILMLLMPTNNTVDSSSNDVVKDNLDDISRNVAGTLGFGESGANFIGIGIILVGALLLMSQLGWLLESGFIFALLIIVGLFLLFRRKR